MRYTLHFASLAEGRRQVVSWVLVRGGTVLLERENARLGAPTSEFPRLMMRKALREAAKQEGIVDLTLSFDSSVSEIAFELMGISEPDDKQLDRTLRRVLRRLNSYKFAAAEYGEADATPAEAACIDNCLDQLEDLTTLKGVIKYYKTKFKEMFK
ncbi:hypothetical protein J26TS2_01160 [Shouchella clausii]|nr:hypothetical protein J26TS2_01160 [Shouchella clausii]